MKFKGGYIGKNLYIDLTSKTIKMVEVNDRLFERYIGGTGVAVKILWEETEPGCDPLSAKSLLMFTTGPLTGTLSPSSGSIEICFKSPLTKLFAESRSGGSFGPKLKYAGFDNVIITGKADQPVYIWIDNGEVYIKEAKHLWGKTTLEATREILSETSDDEASVAAIGPAGENLVNISGIVIDAERASARCGGGAVMGSKNLKAVVVNGDHDVKISDVSKFSAVIKEAEGALRNYPFLDAFSVQGTWSLVEMQNTLGALPTKNWQTAFFENADRISADVFLRKYSVARGACPSCPIGCKRFTAVKGGIYQTPIIGGPEYETIDMFGPNICCDNPELIIRANYLCNMYGLDTVSVGAAISFLMECLEHGVITEDKVGFSLEWGKEEHILEIIESIARSEGIGKLLGQGTKAASEKLGEATMEFAPHVKGLEPPGHDPRVEKSLAIQYMTAPRGCCHMHPNWPGAWDLQMDCGLRPFGLPPYPEGEELEETGIGRSKAYKLLALHGTIAEVTTTCIFVCWGPENGCITPALFAKLLSASTGELVSAEKLLLKAERVYNLKRCYNLREGMSSADEILPKRFKDPIKGGPTNGVAIKDEKGLLQEFYAECGWDDKGIPTKVTLKRLDLMEVADHLQI